MEEKKSAENLKGYYSWAGFIRRWRATCCRLCDHWKSRLLIRDGKPKNFDYVIFRNGFQKQAPELKVEFKNLFEEAAHNNWNLYADLSAVCTPFREGYIREIMKLSNIIPADRLIFGSDYPIPLSELTYNKNTNLFAWIKFLLKAAKIKNPLDKNYFIIKGMDFGDEVFTNASMLFSHIKR